MTPTGFTTPALDLDHPWRSVLSSEIHSRPFLDIQAPAEVSHIAIFCDSDLQIHQALLASLCQHYGVAPPAEGHRNFSYTFSDFRLKWESHTEFSSYTLARSTTSTDAFSDPPHRYLPQAWLQQLRGLVMVATHLFVEKHDQQEVDGARLRSLFSGPVIAGSHTVGARAEVWSDFRVRADGFSRFLVRDIDLLFMQTGRLAQRLVEIETYRTIALLGLPQAQTNQPLIRQIEDELSTLTQGMGTANSPEDEYALMQSLITLAARVEAMSLASNNRFAAVQAYWRIVQARIADIRERRIEGYPTIAEFMDRRLVPAIEFCATINTRQQALAERVAHASDLLRTRVSINQERQNSAILASLNRRAKAQLRLQQAVEGFSTVAITYYVVGLIGYFSKGLKTLGLGVNADLVSVISIPIVIVATWIGVRRLRRSLSERASQEFR
ncbi:MAG: DUF3422 domain-containing protein [Uliginosibacterium sp.]|jgi:uncharacterized membrane-anchored protein|nr:DUF3422 domain-containing protein [Uliginosibacterium sp.]MBK9392910.1 DUF3422 domain-containing protein [Uliginosibacterium sp.]MBK9614752.1 DUF3422 domain-containing protein [Uliginosibacterium sp.]